MNDVKCRSCKIMDEIAETGSYCCCKWYMDNVVCGDKTVDECTMYIKKGENKNVEN